jgi:hypothetical protein
LREERQGRDQQTGKGAQHLIIVQGARLTSPRLSII